MSLNLATGLRSADHERIKKNVSTRNTILLLVGLSLLIAPANANLITTDPGWMVNPMPPVNFFGSGPQTFGGPITVTWTSTNAFDNGGAVFGFDPPSTFPYGFGSNGTWSGVVMAGVNDATDLFGDTNSMTFTFSAPVAGVGGFINYDPDFSTPTTIAVYDGSNLIESHVLSFSTAGGINEGMFLGFQESTPITSFVLTDNFIGITNFEILPTPEPTSLILLGSGLLGAFAFRRKFLKRQAN